MKICISIALAALLSVVPGFSQNKERPRASDLGLKVGVLPTGPLNAITDVGGVEVGHTTIVRGDNIRTGVPIDKAVAILKKHQVIK